MTDATRSGLREILAGLDRDTLEATSRHYLLVWKGRIPSDVSQQTAVRVYQTCRELIKENHK